MFQITPLLGTQQIRIAEQEIFERYKHEFQVMEQAGLAAFQHVMAMIPKPESIAVVCGHGNNAGDGLVLAYLAKQANLNVSVLFVTHNPLSPCAEIAKQKCLEEEITFENFSAAALDHADVIIDAMLGIGIKDSVRPPFSDAIAIINQQNKPVVAIDVPSGLCATSGKILGCCISATSTITFIAKKIGLYTGDARNHTGTIELATLGWRADSNNLQASTSLIKLSQHKQLLPKRKRHVHKGHFGHVLVIGGDNGYGGAALLAANAAWQVGAGLVSIATRPAHVPAMIAHNPALMAHGIRNLGALKKLIKQASLIILGPGLGQSRWSKQLFKTTLKLSTDKTVIIDADGLNLLATQHQKRDNWILTPHPGETARLLESSVADIENDRIQASLNLVSRFGGTVLLKGAYTIINNKNKHAYIIEHGNPGMARAGMGDVLSGMIGGLLAPNYFSALTTTKLAACCHSYSADTLIKQVGEHSLNPNSIAKSACELL